MIKKIKTLTLVLIVYQNLSQAETIQMMADPWCPITCDAKSKSPGVLIEVAKKIFEDVGIQFNYQNSPWVRAVDQARQNKIDGIVGALVADAPDFIFPEISVINQQSCFFTKDKKIKYANDLKFLKDKTLGIVKNYTYGKPLDEYILKNPNLVDSVFGTEVTQSLFLKLVYNRNQMIVEDKNVADYFLFFNRNTISGLSDITNAGCMNPEPLFLAFSPKGAQSKRYAEIFSKGVLKMQKNQELKKIFLKYGLVYKPVRH